MIHLTDQCYWLYAAINPETNEFLYVRLFPIRIIVLTKHFLQELQEKYDIADILRTVLPF